jgi:hypothetical protein
LKSLGRHFLHSTKAKGTSTGTILIIVIIAVAGIYGYDHGWFGNLNLPFGVQSGGNNQQTSNIDKKLEFSLTDQFSGTAQTGKELLLYSGGAAPVLLETLTPTGAGGIIDTAKKYATGTPLYVKYVDGDTKQWWSITVPTMSPADAQASTVNPIDLNTFTIGSYTDTLTVSAVDASANYTVSTMSGNTAPIFVYQITNGGSDNTGVRESAMDPVYGDAWQTYLVVSITGAGYETVLPSGFDQTFQIGQTTYGVIHLSADALTKWKVGNTYEMGYTGGQTCTFSLDLTGYTVKTAVMTVTAYAYCDPSYAISHGGNFGNAKVVLSSDTCDLKVSP